MSTALTIVRRAMRAMGALSSGKEPSGADQTDGLERLQSLVLGLPGLLLGGRWRERAVSAACTAKEGDRLTVTGAVTITLPTTIACDGCTRPPLDLARVYVLGADAVVDYGGEEDGAAGLYLFSATTGAWGPLTGLAIDDDLPFGAEDEAGLAAQLAVDWCEEYGGDVTARTIASAQISARSFRSRFSRSAPTDYGRPDLDSPTRLTNCPDTDCADYS